MAYVKDSDGKWHTIIDQVKGSSCGPACVRMVAKLKGKDVGEEQVRQLIEKKEGGKASILTSGNSQYKSGDHNWGKHGGYGSKGGGEGTWKVDAALEALNIPYREINGDPSVVLNRTTYSKPGIAVVRWSTGGLHWIVVAGKLKNGDFIVLDPACGLKEVSANKNVPGYIGQGTLGAFTGKMFITT